MWESTADRTKSEKNGRDMAKDNYPRPTRSARRASQIPNSSLFASFNSSLSTFAAAVAPHSVDSAVLFPPHVCSTNRLRAMST